MPIFERNDAFGPGSHNSLLQRQDFLYNFLGVEHDPATGEHNTIHVARTLGAVKWSGAAYSLEGFNSDVTLETGHNPAAGTVVLTLAADRYDWTQAVVEVQGADSTGNVTPWLVTKAFSDVNTRLTVFLKKNTAGVGAQQVFAATDGSFFIGVRSPRLPNSVARPAGAVYRSRDEGLRADASNWNPMVQAMGTNRVAFLDEHTAEGAHDAHEVAKAWGVATFDSATSAYSYDSFEGMDARIDRIATGQVRVYPTAAVPAVVAPVQAFADPLCAATDELTLLTSHNSGLRTTMVPTGTCGANSIDVFLYDLAVNVNHGTSPATITYRWAAADFDFFVRVHGA